MDEEPENLLGPGDDVRDEADGVRDEADGVREGGDDDFEGGDQTVLETMNLEIPKSSPKFWKNWKYIILHFCLVFMSLSILAIVMIILSFVPVSENISVIGKSADIILLPKPNHTSWLTRLSFQTKGSCNGKLYQLPCSKMQVKHDKNYNTNYKNDLVYCISNTTFMFTHIDSGAANGFVTNKYETFDEYTTDDKYINCSDLVDLPPDVHCIHFDSRDKLQSIKNITINLQPDSGSYYYIRTSNNSRINYRIDRYYVQYDNSYESYYKGTVTKEKSIHINLQSVFKPWSFDDSDDCLLLKVAEYCETHDHYTFIVIPEKRHDILLWPMILCFISIVLIVLYVCLCTRLDFKNEMKVFLRVTANS